MLSRDISSVAMSKSFHFMALQFPALLPEWLGDVPRNLLAIRRARNVSDNELTPSM
jgi:hypothetical protein